MKIIKFEHSCFYLEKNGRGLIFDPVEYKNKLPDFENIDVIIITHSHFDHFQPKVIEKILSKNQNCKIFTTIDNASNILNSYAVKDGDMINVSEFSLQFYGNNHSEIIAGIIPCQNIGTIVNGIFANSADSFDIPPVRPEILAVPLSAPWLKIRETLDFIKKVRPKIMVPTHDGLNSELGNIICDNWIKKVCEEVGCEYKEVHYGKI